MLPSLIVVKKRKKKNSFWGIFVVGVLVFLLFASKLHSLLQVNIQSRSFVKATCENMSGCTHLLPLFFSLREDVGDI